MINLINYDDIAYSDYDSFLHEVSNRRNSVYGHNSDILEETNLKFNVSELNSIPNGRFAVVSNGIEFDCCFNYKDERKLYVILNGGRPNPNCIIPYFNRFSYYNLLDGSMINIADPMYKKYPNLSVGWYYGNKSENYLDYLTEVIIGAAKALNKRNEDIILLSSSAGGYAALYCGCRIPGCTVLAINPQISLPLYPSDNFTKNTGIDFNEEDPHNRNCLYTSIISADKTKFVLLENIQAEIDMIQISEFSKKCNLEIKFGLNQVKENIITWLYDANSKNPHNAQEYKALMHFILMLTDPDFNVNENKELFAAVSELWHERFEIFSSKEIQENKSKKLITDISDFSVKSVKKVLFEDENLQIPPKDYIHNHYVIYKNLKPNTIYELEISDISLTCGETSIVTILIRDVNIGYFQYAKTGRVDQPLNFRFKTNIDTSGLELRIYTGEIYKCSNIGLNLGKICLTEYLSEENTRRIESDEDKFCLNLLNLQKGKRIADKICTNDNCTTYVVINRHIGDAARNCSVFKAYKEYYSEDKPYHFMDAHSNNINIKAFPKKRCVKKLVIITTPLLSGVVRMCDAVDEIIQLSKAELNNLELYAASNCKTHPNLFPDEDSQNNMLKFNLYQIGTFAYQFNLPKNIGCDRLDSLSLPQGSLDAASKIIDDLKINVKKTIILCPMAQSSSLLGAEYWAKIIEFLKLHDFDIYTNIGKNEKELDGTSGLFVPIDVICGLVKKGCKVIGIQSGLIDLFVWLKLNSPTIILSLLNNERDIQFAKNRNLNNSITKKGSITYILVKKDEIENSYNDITKAVEESFI